MLIRLIYFALGAIDQLPEATTDFEDIPTRPHAYSKKRQNIQKEKEWKRRRESLEKEADVIPKKKMRGQVHKESVLAARRDGRQIA